MKIKKIIGLEIGALVVLGLVVAGILSYRAALVRLQTEIEAYIGDGAEVGEIKVGFRSVEIFDLRIPRGKNWPNVDQLRARRIEVVPNFRSLLKGRIEAGKIRVYEPYLSVVRTRSGAVRVCPTILEAPARDTPPIRMKSIVITGAHMDVFDYSVGARPVVIKTTHANISLSNVVYPRYNSRIHVRTTARIQGKDATGTVEITGWMVVSTMDSELQTTLRGVDLTSFQPYLSQSAGDATIKQGTMDLNLKTLIKDNVLNARGDITWVNLEFEKTRGVQKFMGVPVAALLHLMKDQTGRINLDFVAEERIDDPNFKVQAALARAIRKTLSDRIGVDFSSPVKDVTTSVGNVADSVSDTLRHVSEKAGKTLENLLNR